MTQPIILPCKSCDKPTVLEAPLWDICKECYRDPETNKCDGCGRKSQVPYPFVCGFCIKAGK